MAGEYVYTYGDGELEMLVLSTDATYDHYIYNSVADARRNANPKYHFKGTWSSSQGVIELSDWMLCARFADLGKPLSQPVRTVSFRGNWYNAVNSGPEGLLIVEDIGYNFLKVHK
jgi:hypothetical protein